MERILRLITWPAALYIAAILLWYEQYKLTGASGSVYLFTILSDWLFIHGHEKAFRLTVGIAEIIAAILVVWPSTRMIGAGFALLIMSGAIFFHTVSPLGIDPYGDGGQLFMEACEVWVLSGFILFVYRVELRSTAWQIMRHRRFAWG
jgi:hypothetical protein